jgi:tetrahydromethanopterin S-methyltransferase subunit H
MDERRGTTRNRTFKAGKIVFNEGRSVIDCAVRNISATGASVGVTNAVAVPEEFGLVVDGAMHACVVAWRRLDRIGIKFQ